ncbi:protein MKS1 [Magnolia sinica]|uniref:protein MKS1 n=1 Tax=Magnolia sinica TaxID=86752 RepID=UPI00265860EC|nr:protein MKS1 [Magnolia sinica]
MDSSEFPTGRPSPRRELQGPRPTPLKVRKDSYKIKKPPMAPAPSQPTLPPPQHRPPVIIYTVSPKVIHTDASEFMKLVQRLTGNSSSSTASTATSSSTSSYANIGSGAISPAARLASIEKTKSLDGGQKSMMADTDMVDQFEIDTLLDRAGPFPGILSPLPASLPPISPNLFSPPTDPSSLSFLHDWSPIFQANKNYMDGALIHSPNTFLSAPITSPTPSMDFFNHFFDL